MCRPDLRPIRNSRHGAGLVRRMAPASRSTAPRTLRRTYSKTLSGAGGEELLLKSIFNKRPTDWSRDGRFIAFSTLDPNTQWDVWVLPMSDRSDRQPTPFLRTNFNEAFGQFSPDGRWLAYVSDESGTNEVYVRMFPDGRIECSGCQQTEETRRDGVATAKSCFISPQTAALMMVSVSAAVPLRGRRAGRAVQDSDLGFRCRRRQLGLQRERSSFTRRRSGS